MLSLKPADYYEGDRRLPVFARISANKKCLLSIEDTVRCILHPQHSKKHLCRKVPTTINHNVMFLVDTAALDDPRDIDSDDMGVWYNNRVDTVNVAVSKDSSAVTHVTKVQRSANKT